MLRNLFCIAPRQFPAASSKLYTVGTRRFLVFRPDFGAGAPLRNTPSFRQSSRSVFGIRSFSSGSSSNQSTGSGNQSKEAGNQSNEHGNQSKAPGDQTNEPGNQSKELENQPNKEPEFIPFWKQQGFGRNMLRWAAIIGGLSLAYIIWRDRKAQTEEEREAALPSWYKLYVKEHVDRVFHAFDPPPERPFNFGVLEPLDEPYALPYVLVIDPDLIVYQTRDINGRVILIKRPGWDFFCQHLSQAYELILWDRMPKGGNNTGYLEQLDTQHLISHHLYADDMSKGPGNKLNLKDIRVLNRDPAKVIMIDWRNHNLEAQPYNTIIAPPYHGEPGDTVLMDLMYFLDGIAATGVKDVRVLLKQLEGMDIVAYAHRFTKEKLINQQHERLAKQRSLF